MAELSFHGLMRQAGASVAAAIDAVMAAAGGDEAGVGASVNSAVRQVGGAIAVAVLGGVLSAGYTRALGPALDTCPPATRPSRARPSPKPPSSPGTSRQAAPCGPPRAVPSCTA